LKEGKAINIKIIAGDIVHINSIKVPWFKYLFPIGQFLCEKFLTIAKIIQPTLNNIIIRKYIIKLCNSTIPSIWGLALSWKYKPQGLGASHASPNEGNVANKDKSKLILWIIYFHISISEITIQAEIIPIQVNIPYTGLTSIEFTGVPHWGQHLPGITQTVLPLAKQVGHFLPALY